jgi:hypothetical protein
VFAAARRLVDRVKWGVTVVFATRDVVGPDRMVEGETDGPGGAAVLARALALGLLVTLVTVVDTRASGRAVDSFSRSTKRQITTLTRDIACHVIRLALESSWRRAAQLCVEAHGMVQHPYDNWVITLKYVTRSRLGKAHSVPQIPDSAAGQACRVHVYGQIGAPVGNCWRGRCESLAASRVWVDHPRLAVVS